MPQPSPWILPGDNPFADAGQAAVANLLSGEFAAAGHAATGQPLSPTERRKLSDRFGLTGSWLAPVVDIVSNPLVIAGIVGTVLWKTPTAAEAMLRANRVSQVANRFKPLEWILPHAKLYEGTDIPDLMDAVLRRGETFMREVDVSLLKTFDKMSKTYGRTDLSDVEQVGIAAHLDDTLNPKAQHWQVLQDLIGYNKKTGVINAEKAAGFGFSPGEVQRLVAKMHTLPAAAPLSESQAMLSAEYRKLFDRSLERVPFDTNKKVAEELADALSGYGGHDTDQLLSMMGGKLERYFPHLTHLSPEELQVAKMTFLKEQLPADLAAKVERVKKDQLVMSQGTKRIMYRAGGMLPDASDLELLGVDKELVGAVQRARELGYNTYSLKLKPVTERYFNDMSRVYSWTVPEGNQLPLGKRIYDAMGAMHDGSAVATNKIRILNDTYIPMLIGGLTDRQVGHNLAMAQTKEWAVQKLASPIAQKFIPTKLRESMINKLVYDPNLTASGLSSKLAGYLHLSTLGGNPLSAGMNLLQTVTTLVPVVGAHVFDGLSAVAKRYPKYMQLRTSGKPVYEAMEEAFPEYHAMHLELDPAAKQKLAIALESSMAQTAGLGAKAASVWSKTSQGLMAMFTKAEEFNRMLSFYSARSKGLKELPGHLLHDVELGQDVLVPASGPLRDRMAGLYARKVTYETQFGSGVLQTPSGTINVPTLLRQFTNYPLRLAGQFLSGGPGLASRMLLTSGAAYAGVKEVTGRDLTHGLLFGGFPYPTENQPFAPFPLVPPALQIAGSGLQALAGDTENLQKSLPLLVPGGIQAARFAGISGMQSVPKAIRRPYADYSQMTPDGRVAVFNPDGSLLAYYSPSELIGRSLGFPSMSQQQEGALTKLLLSSRDDVRQMKRDYMQALLENDADHAMNIQAQYEKKYPNMGGLPIKKSDINALHQRRDVARLERVLKTVPEELRPQFSLMISTSLGADANGLLGLSQQIGNQIPIDREPYRAFTRKQISDKVNRTVDDTSREGIRDQGMADSQASRDAYRDDNDALSGLPGYN